MASRTARTIAVAGAAVAVLLATSCSSADDEGATAARAAIATVPEQTTTTNPYAVPPMIDAAYVNRVLAGLDAAMGDVVRMVMKAGAMTPEAIQQMEALYTGPPLELQINLLIQDSILGFPGMKPDPGNRKTTVTRLLSNQARRLLSKADSRRV